jgi:Domain of unknown function (DUF3943)
MTALSRAQRGIGAIVLALAGSSATAAGQSLHGDPQSRLLPFTLAPGAADAFVAAAGTQPAPAWYTEGRACEGCPPRRIGRSIFQLTMVNVLYGLGNLARGQVTARVTPETWWANMEQGWVWDLDDFTVNQFGHPYQGSNYFNTGRSNGLNFYESAVLTAFGSSTWEYFGETNHASLNDFINTTLGGIALGEAFHRAAWLMRDTRATGSGRLWREIAATIVDPLTGYNRFRSGDAKLVTDKPREMVPSTLGAVTSLGVLWRGSDTNAFSATGQPVLEMDLLYGDLEAGRTRVPYDAMSTRLRLGGGSAISEARVRGRLVGQPLNDGRLQLSVLQSYGYEKNDAYSTGSQSFEVAIGGAHDFSSQSKLRVVGWGGLTVLGAIDSLPLGVEEVPDEEEEAGEGAGQGVSEGPRFYDYGPGANFGAVTQFTRGGRPIAVLNYEARHIYSLDGVRVNHFLQKTRFDLMVPVKGRFGVGAAAEYFSRKSYYQDLDRTVKGYSYPQVRAYFTWSQR